MKAPSEVDTLRDEACPVCGETDAWDGDTCKVCGFVAPPDKFQDPDVDLHKKLDLRNNSDLDGGDVGGLNADINDRDGDGLDDNTGEPVGDATLDGADVQPMLTCPNCGYEVEGGEPQTVSTEDEVMGDASAPSPDGPAAGDLCPNCGQAPLMSPQEIAEAGLGEPDPEGDPDADPEQMQAGEPDSDDPQRGPDAEQDPDANSEDDGDDYGSPFPSGKDDGDEEESDDAVDSDDDDSEDDESDPAKKKFPPKKK